MAWLNVITIGALVETLPAPPAGATETSDVATEAGPVVVPEQAKVPARIALTKAPAARRIDMARFLSRDLIVSTEGNLAARFSSFDEAQMKEGFKDSHRVRNDSTPTA
jgi:hypothetical protein